MPIYEYACTQCGHEFETLQRISEDPLRQCPACNEDALIKKVSAAAFVLKGTGWYETDFKDQKKKPDGDGKPAEESATADGKSDTKSDDKKSTDQASDKKADASATSSDKSTADGGESKAKPTKTGTPSTGKSPTAKKS